MSTAESRNRLLNFEIQHIIPLQILKDKSGRLKPVLGFLSDVQFNFESKGNKIGLLIDENVRDAIRKAPDNLRSAFISAGFGWNTHKSQGNDGGHPGYNAFVIDVLTDFAERAVLEKWDPEVCERAFYDFHEFLYKINSEGNIPINGTSQQVFTAEWEGTGSKEYGMGSKKNFADMPPSTYDYSKTPIDDSKVNNPLLDNFREEKKSINWLII